MKAAIYSPYLDTFGGGEKYMMTIAEILSQNNLETDVLLDRNLLNIGAEFLKSNLSERFDIDLSKVIFIKAPIGKDSSFLKRLFFLKKYDVFFYLTDGSIFFSSSKKNILHIQSPLIGQPAKGKWGKIKLKSWDEIIYNSLFTKKYSEKNWPIKSQVIYPPVDVKKIKSLNKKSYILSVGRFFGYLRDKKHRLLIKSFRELLKEKEVVGWSLHLVGSAQEGDKKYLSELKKYAKNLPINFYPNLSYNKLLDLYGHSSIYWHASGFGENNPTRMEHFGISIVEAMAGGCIPVVIGKAGPQEIVEDKKSGFLWNKAPDLKDLTFKLINDQKLRKKVQKESTERSKIYSKEKFEKSILQLI